MLDNNKLFNIINSINLDGIQINDVIDNIIKLYIKESITLNSLKIIKKKFIIDVNQISNNKKLLKTDFLKIYNKFDLFKNPKLFPDLEIQRFRIKNNEQEISLIKNINMLIMDEFNLNEKPAIGDIYFYITLNNNIISSLQINIEKDKKRITNFATSSKMRKIGLGTYLLNYALTYLNEVNKIIYLHVNKTKSTCTNLIKFYSNLGFVRCSELDRNNGIGLAFCKNCNDLFDKYFLSELTGAYLESTLKKNEIYKLCDNDKPIQLEIEFENDILILDYSDKSLLIKGDYTKNIKQELKDLNCKWNPTLKGWIVSKKKYYENFDKFNYLLKSEDSEDSEYSEDKKEVKKEDKKEVKKEDKKEVNKEPNKEAKKEPKKEAKKKQQKNIKQQLKSDDIIAVNKICKNLTSDDKKFLGDSVSYYITYGEYKNVNNKYTTYQVCKLPRDENNKIISNSFLYNYLLYNLSSYIYSLFYDKKNINPNNVEWLITFGISKDDLSLFKNYIINDINISESEFENIKLNWINTLQKQYIKFGGLYKKSILFSGNYLDKRKKNV